MERNVEDENVSMGNLDAYCTNNKRRLHATNNFKALEVDILDLIA